MLTTRLRNVVKVTRQANGKTWQVALWVPREDGRVHVLGKVLADGFELRKLAKDYAVAYRKGLVTS
jgi:hypothetical protein